MKKVRWVSIISFVVRDFDVASILGLEKGGKHSHLLQCTANVPEGEERKAQACSVLRGGIYNVYEFFHKSYMLEYIIYTPLELAHIISDLQPVSRIWVVSYTHIVYRETAFTIRVGSYDIRSVTRQHLWSMWVVSHAHIGYRRTHIHHMSWLTWFNFGYKTTHIEHISWLLLLIATVLRFEINLLKLKKNTRR